MVDTMKMVIYPGESTLKPTVSSINSTTYNLSQHLATILASFVVNTRHHVHNSTDVTGKIENLQLDTDKTMVCFDVTSLFTCIPTAEAVETDEQD